MHGKIDREPSREGHGETGCNGERGLCGHHRLARQHQSEHDRGGQRDRRSQYHANQQRETPPIRQLVPAANVHPLTEPMRESRAPDAGEVHGADDFGRVLVGRHQQVATQDVRDEAAPARSLANPVRTARGGWRHFSKPRVRVTCSGLLRNLSSSAKNHWGSSYMMKCRAESAMAKCNFGSFANCCSNVPTTSARLSAIPYFFSCSCSPAQEPSTSVGAVIFATSARTSIPMRSAIASATVR